MTTTAITPDRREHKHSKWTAQESFAERIRTANQRAVDDPEGWIAELLETAETLD